MSMTDEMIHVVARLLLRAMAPLRAHAVLQAIGGLLPPRPSHGDDVRRTAKKLARRGTCLSRALAISALAPDVDVVIGVLPPDQRGSGLAHAWVEIRGKPLDAADIMGVEIARIPGRRGVR
jgi:hypothetical protein